MHRDLAIRNILLGENNVVKIGDFGLARYIQKGEIDWKLERQSSLPVRYVAPECFSKKRFSFATDVWAFGVLLWELMTFGDVPYQSQGVDVANIRDYVTSGQRLSPPMVLLSINTFPFS